MADKDLDFGLEPNSVWGREPIEDSLVWWGYLHTNGTLILKRYLDYISYKEAGESDFVEWQSRLFESPTQTEAFLRLKRMVEHYKRQKV